MEKDDLLEAFAFLDNLRESGVCNMFGAGEYIQEGLGFEKTQARTALKLWMDTFDGQSTVAARVEKALASA